MTNEDEPQTGLEQAAKAPANHALPRSGCKHDLGERTAKFGETVIGFASRLKVNAVTGPLIRQIVRSATSIGANYCEADEAGSKKEFRYRISVCRRESRETHYWLRMLATAAPAHKEEARALWKESHALTRIFAAIFRKSSPQG